MRRLAAVAAMVLAGCTGGSPSDRPASPATSTPRPTPSPTVAIEPLLLLVLGDSIGIPSMGCGACEGFDRQYAAWLEGATRRQVRIENQARPNAQIKDLQAVLDTETEVQRLVAAADIVVVTIGYNNGPNWDPTDPCHAPEGHTIAESLRITVEYLTTACVADQLAIFQAKLDRLYGRIETLAAGRAQLRVTLGVYANLDGNVGLDDDGTISTVSHDELAQAISVNNRIIDAWNVMDCAVATQHGFVCGDIHHAFNGPSGDDPVEGLVNPSDYVHPNEAGQHRIAELLEGIDVSVLTGS